MDQVKLLAAVCLGWGWARLMCGCCGTCDILRLSDEQMQQEESPLAEILVTSKVVGELKVAKQDGQVPQDDMVSDRSVSTSYLRELIQYTVGLTARAYEGAWNLHRCRFTEFSEPFALMVWYRLSYLCLFFNALSIILLAA